LAAAIDGEGVDGEGGLTGVLEKVVDDDLGNRVALQFEDDAAVLVGLFRIALMSVMIFSLARLAMAPRSGRVERKGHR
jgi:hypothetical protein